MPTKLHAPVPPSPSEPRGAHAWIRNNILGLVAIFFALSGSAVATQVATQGGAKIAKAKKGPRGPAGPTGPQGAQGAPGSLTGAASGALTGNYPNPSIAPGAIGTTELSNSIPTAHVTHSADQLVANGASMVLAFDTERYDTAGMHNPSVNNSRLVAPIPGIYLVTAEVDWTTNTSNQRVLALSKNGGLTGTTVGEVAGGPSDVGGFSIQEVTAQVRLNANDYVEVVVSQQSGSPLNVLAVPERSSEFSMTWLAPGP